MPPLEPLCDFLRNPLSLVHTSIVASAALLTRRAVLANPANPPTLVKDLITLPLPLSIELKINSFMTIVKQEMDDWRDFHDKEVFFDRADASVSRASQFFDLLLWSTDGTIDSKSTAQEMLKLDALSVEEKYRIACNHCLKNEIEKLRLKTEDDMRKTDFCHPLLDYWDCVFRKKGFFGLSSAISSVFKNGYDYPASTIDHFLKNFNHELIAKRLFWKMPFKSLQNFLMNLLGGELYMFVNTESSHDVMHTLLKFWMHADFVLHVWNRVRDVIKDFESGFGFLMLPVISLVPPLSSSDHISLALEIWKNEEPSHSDVLDEYIERRWWDRDSNLADVRLDVAILSHACPNYRRYDFWPNHWLELFEKYPFDSFKQFMNVCCKGEEFKDFKDLARDALHSSLLEFLNC